MSKYSLALRESMIIIVIVAAVVIVIVIVIVIVMMISPITVRRLERHRQSDRPTGRRRSDFHSGF